MSSPLTVAGALSFPIDEGSPAIDVPMSFIGQFDESTCTTVKLTDTGSMAVSLGTIDAVKGLLVKVDANVDAAPVRIRVNGLAAEADGFVEVSPGGMLLLCSPNPVDGITSIDVDWTTDNTIRMWAFG